MFGSIIAINIGQVTTLFTITVVVALLTTLFIRSMYILIFDEETAFVGGLSARLMSVLFSIMIGIAITLTILAAGAPLVSAIMVLSASIAIRLGKNPKPVILTGVIVGSIGAVTSIITSYYRETPTSATIAVISVEIFLLANLSNMVFHRNS